MDWIRFTLLTFVPRNDFLARVVDEVNPFRRIRSLFLWRVWVSQIPALILFRVQD
jgi:hypothetical protein